MKPIGFCKVAEKIVPCALKHFPPVSPSLFKLVSVKKTTDYINLLVPEITSNAGVEIQQ